MIPSFARAGVVALAGSFLAVGVTDLPGLDPTIGVTYAVLAVVLVVPYVRIVPGLPLPVADLAVTIGFLHVLGPVVVVIRSLAPIVPSVVGRLAPRAFGGAFDEAAHADRRVGPERFSWGWAVAWGTFVLGLAARWVVVETLAPGTARPTGGPVPPAHVVALAELAGYLVWAALALLPIYPDRPLVVRTKAMRGALGDMLLVVGLALTPFVFLITYGYRLHGLAGAAAWSLSALGVHVVLARLNERRLLVERQAERLEGLHHELAQRERLSAIGETSSVVSHQILQQLGTIGLFADATQNLDASLSPAEALARARRNAARITQALRSVDRTLNDLLVFARDLRVHPWRHPMGAIVDEVLANARDEAARRGVELRAEGPLDLEADVDKLKLVQALGNVVRNAIEASPEGARVVVRVEPTDEHLELVVEDEGPGVAVEDRERIFAPFVTTRDAGTGLGLAIAREFVRAHGGSIEVAGRPGGPGARFVLRLPRAA